MKYLWAYSASNDFAVKWNEKCIQKRRELGYDIRGFCLTPDYLGNRHWFPFNQLDYLWKTGYPPLIKMYRELNEALHGVDVLIHYNGANIHPDVVNELNVFKVYTCGDDPESTEHLSKPVAACYDIQMVNNAACLDMYKSWGLKNVFFWPLGSLVTPEEIEISREDIISKPRKEKIVFVGEKNPYKESFLTAIEKKYPDGQFWGKNWRNGFASDEKMKELYYNSQIGINLHNSIGPINFRLYELSAYGVMQICDNKENLSKVYELDREIIGYSSEKECLGKIDYFLTHMKEQREIALAAYDRWIKDYTPDAVWRSLVKVTERFFSESSHSGNLELLLIKQEKKNNIANKLLERVRRSL